MKKVIVIFLIIVCTIPIIAKEKKAIFNDSIDVFFVLKTSLGNCPKCVVVTYDTFEKIKHKFDKDFKISFITYVICDRKKEIKLFTRRYKFIDRVYDFNDSKVPNIIKNSSDMFFILDNKGNLLISFNVYQLNNFKKIYNDISNILKIKK